MFFGDLSAFTQEYPAIGQVLFLCNEEGEQDAAPFILRMRGAGPRRRKSPTSTGSWKGLGESEAQAFALGLSSVILPSRGSLWEAVSPADVAWRCPCLGQHHSDDGVPRMRPCHPGQESNAMKHSVHPQGGMAGG